MKTIKELEAEEVGFRIGYKSCKEDVLGLIDERIKKAKMDIQNAYECDYVDYQKIESKCLAIIDQLEELKARIIGE